MHIPEMMDSIVIILVYLILLVMHSTQAHSNSRYLKPWWRTQRSRFKRVVSAIACGNFGTHCTKLDRYRGARLQVNYPHPHLCFQGATFSHEKLSDNSFFWYCTPPSCRRFPYLSPFCEFIGNASINFFEMHILLSTSRLLLSLEDRAQQTCLS